VLGIRRIELVTGGSIGGMITLCLRELLGERVSVCMPIAACAAASPWIIGWNHVGRQLLLAAGLDGEVGRRALSLARQLALISYRAEPGLEQRQGRRMVGTDTWDAGASYAMQTYLEHQGRKLLARFSARAYFVQLGAMDHHDVSRLPYGRAETGCSHLIAVGINSDQLFYKVHSESLVDDALRLGQSAEYRELNSLHGHDGFLIEWEQMDTLTRYALSKIQTA
jgi:homoserine O-acetyltransferase